MHAFLARCLSLVILFALAGGIGASEIYKWTAPDGTVHYGDRPAENVEAEQLDIESRPTDPARIAALAEQRAEARRESRQAEQAAAAEEPTPEEERRRQQEREEQCTMYKERLQRFTRSRRLYREDENGERVYLTEQEMQEARDRVQDNVEEFCNS